MENNKPRKTRVCSRELNSVRRHRKPVSKCSATCRRKISSLENVNQELAMTLEDTRAKLVRKELQLDEELNDTVIDRIKVLEMETRLHNIYIAFEEKYSALRNLVKEFDETKVLLKNFVKDFKEILPKQTKQLVPEQKGRRSSHSELKNIMEGKKIETVEEVSEPDLSMSLQGPSRAISEKNLKQSDDSIQQKFNIDSHSDHLNIDPVQTSMPKTAAFDLHKNVVTSDLPNDLKVSGEAQNNIAGEIETEALEKEICKTPILVHNPLIMKTSSSLVSISDIKQTAIEQSVIFSLKKTGSKIPRINHLFRDKKKPVSFKNKGYKSIPLKKPIETVPRNLKNTDSRRKTFTIKKPELLHFDTPNNLPVQEKSTSENNIKEVEKENCHRKTFVVTRLKKNLFESGKSLKAMECLNIDMNNMCITQKDRRGTFVISNKQDFGSGDTSLHKTNSDLINKSIIAGSEDIVQEYHLSPKDSHNINLNKSNISLKKTTNSDLITGGGTTINNEDIVEKYHSPQKSSHNLNLNKNISLKKAANSNSVINNTLTDNNDTFQKIYSPQKGIHNMNLIKIKNNISLEKTTYSNLVTEGTLTDIEDVPKYHSPEKGADNMNLNKKPISSEKTAKCNSILESTAIDNEDMVSIKHSVHVDHETVDYSKKNSMSTESIETFSKINTHTSKSDVSMPNIMSIDNEKKDESLLSSDSGGKKISDIKDIWSDIPPVKILGPRKVISEVKSDKIFVFDINRKSILKNGSNKYVNKKNAVQESVDNGLSLKKVTEENVMDISAKQEKLVTFSQNVFFEETNNVGDEGSKEISCVYENITLPIIEKKTEASKESNCAVDTAYIKSVQNTKRKSVLSNNDSPTKKIKRNVSKKQKDLGWEPSKIYKVNKRTKGTDKISCKKEHFFKLKNNGHSKEREEEKLIEKNYLYKLKNKKNGKLASYKNISEELGFIFSPVNNEAGYSKEKEENRQYEKNKRFNKENKKSSDDRLFKNTSKKLEVSFSNDINDAGCSKEKGDTQHEKNKRIMLKNIKNNKIVSDNLGKNKYEKQDFNLDTDIVEACHSKEKEEYTHEKKKRIEKDDIKLSDRSLKNTSKKLEVNFSNDINEAGCSKEKGDAQHEKNKRTVLKNIKNNKIISDNLGKNKYEKQDFNLDTDIAEAYHSKQKEEDTQHEKKKQIKKKNINSSDMPFKNTSENLDLKFADDINEAGCSKGKGKGTQDDKKKIVLKNKEKNIISSNDPVKNKSEEFDFNLDNDINEAGHSKEKERKQLDKKKIFHDSKNNEAKILPDSLDNTLLELDAPLTVNIDESQHSRRLKNKNPKKRVYKSKYKENKSPDDPFNNAVEGLDFQNGDFKGVESKAKKGKCSVVKKRVSKGKNKENKRSSVSSYRNYILVQAEVHAPPPLHIMENSGVEHTKRLSIVLNDILCSQDTNTLDINNIKYFKKCETDMPKSSPLNAIKSNPRSSKDSSYGDEKLSDVDENKIVLRRRNKKVASYKEPALNKKMRREKK